MNRTYTLGAHDGIRFVLLYNGFVAGGNALHTGQTATRTRDDRAKEAKVIRALKSVAQEATAEGQLAILPGGGSFTLDQKCHELLVKYLEAAPFDTQVSDVVDELIDWVAAAQSE